MRNYLLVVLALSAVGRVLAALPLFDGHYQMIGVVEPCEHESRLPLCVRVKTDTRSEHRFRLEPSQYNNSLESLSGIRLVLSGAVHGSKLALDAPPRVHKLADDNLFDDRNELKRTGD